MGIFDRFRGRPPMEVKKEEMKKPEPKVEMVSEKKETSGKMNLLTNYAETVKVLIDMEGQRWFDDQERFGSNSIAGALKDAQNQSSNSWGGTIYGEGGVHRYAVYKDGSVKYSESHGRAKLEKAKELGFEII